MDNNLKLKNRIVLASFMIFIVICLIIIGVRKQNDVPVEAQLTTTQPSSYTETQNPTTIASAETSTQQNIMHKGEALFIGDSRTVGISEYAQLEHSDFFCDVGMSVYNISKKTLSVENVGKVSLEELLSQKQYSKVYIMLGINEVGYNMNTTLKKYQALLDKIQEYQPDAYIFVQANLHVTKERSDKDDVVNNANLNQLNDKLKTLADGTRIFYLDANLIFDDANGNLGADKTGDNAHLYAKFYKQWGEWIINESNQMILK